MKAIVASAPNEYALREVPVPVPPRGWARLKVLTAAFCATDLEALSGGIAVKYPLTPGHEWCGAVDLINGEDQSLLGRRVVGSNDVCCLTCKSCRSGMWRNCASFGEIGFAHNGAYAEYMLVPLYALRALPENISDIQACMLEPLGVALGTLDKVEARMGDTLLILGAGSIGLNMLAAGKAAGMRRITVVERSGGRLGIAREMGASYVIASAREDAEQAIRKIYPEGPDVIIDCTGSEDCAGLALRVAPRSGRVALAGYGRQRDFRLHIDDIHIKNLRVAGAGNNWNVVDRCVDLVADGIVSTERLCTHVLPIERFEEAVEAAKVRAPGFVKTVFDLRL
jgi:L-iditol 2-dehydrogenase